VPAAAPRTPEHQERIAACAPLGSTHTSDPLKSRRQKRTRWIPANLHSRGIDLRAQAHTRQTAVESWHTLAYDPPVWTYGKRTTDGGDWLGGPLVAW
jgi:hypothetical protein